MAFLGCKVVEKRLGRVQPQRALFFTVNLDEDFSSARIS